MGMDYKYSGSVSYGRFDKELCKEQLIYLIDKMCFEIKDCFALAPIPAIYIAYIEEPYKYIVSTHYFKSQMLSDECERHFIENVESRIIDYVCKDRIGLERN